MAPEDGATEPLILTLQMDERSQDWFDRLRELHFPPERNYLRAPHALPQAAGSPGSLPTCNWSPGPGATYPYRDGYSQPRPGRGLRALVAGTGGTAAGVAKNWEPWLGAQDRQGFKPHVTVQNKVSPERARALHERLLVTFSPLKVGGVGLSPWRYLGGPWESIGADPFGERPEEGGS